MEKVSIRLPLELVEDLEDVVIRKRYRNMSDAIRDAVSEFVKRNRPGAPDSVDIQFPPGLMAGIFDLLDIKEFKDIDDLVIFAVRKYVEDRLSKLREDMLMLDEGKILALKRISQRSGR